MKEILEKLKKYEEEMKRLARYHDAMNDTLLPYVLSKYRQGDKEATDVIRQWDIKREKKTYREEI